MGEWTELGPFRVRVQHEARPGEGSFRESAAQKVHEIHWSDAQSQYSSDDLERLMVLAIIVITMMTLSYFKESVPWWANLACGAVLVFYILYYLSKVSFRRFASAKEHQEAHLRIDADKLAFSEGEAERSFPRARVEVQTREVDGKHQAVLISDSEQVVLYDSRHEFEVDWLVKRVKEALAN